MQKLSVSKWLSVNIFIWGGVTMALAACTHFQPFLGLRFVLGALDRWLNAQEKYVAVHRLGPKHSGTRVSEIKMYQMWEALADPKTWFFFLCGVCTQVVNGAASNFGSLIIEGFGYSNIVTTLFQIPYGMVILVSNVSAMYIQRWLPGQKRCIVGAIYQTQEGPPSDRL
ncbi:hypothetical protein AtubIFM55763_006069 [Aspergillus tubingensis]|nr:hypothetical protein AtubIFM55763_006069 [Aspergillus tubingensis]GLA99311.1 hypothetical protein AtubIFM57143_007618 [Aspergillus tubingensis]GLB23034.1 hypothetical protein AtubIFM61612_003618 [Aspergillus tubingensis]